jgi:hypothetical protein
MALWGNIEPAASRLIKDINTDELQDRLDQMREQIGSLTRAFRRNAGRQAVWARDTASDTVDDIEDAMKDNLAASLVLALSVGIVVGYLIRRGSE